MVFPSHNKVLSNWLIQWFLNSGLISQSSSQWLVKLYFDNQVVRWLGLGKDPSILTHIGQQHEKAGEPVIYLKWKYAKGALSLPSPAQPLYRAQSCLFPPPPPAATDDCFLMPSIRPPSLWHTLLFLPGSIRAWLLLSATWLHFHGISGARTGSKSGTPQPDYRLPGELP